jgi:23S rRNA (guanosine2251-2'-O)-methyltransferase
MKNGRVSEKVFGVAPVTEALRSGKRRIEKIFILEGAHENRLSEIGSLAARAGIKVEKVSRSVIERGLPPETNHQGVLAFASANRYYQAEELLENLETKALALVLDGIEDPQNLGVILRTAECSGVDCVFIPERRAVGLNETVAKSSAGAIEYVKVAQVTNVVRLIEKLKAKNIWTVGTSVGANTSYEDWDWTQPSALILGSEGRGLHRLVAESCDVLVKIPMYGKIESLNVSVAAGVILFEANRQRRLKDAKSRGGFEPKRKSGK